MENTARACAIISLMTRSLSIFRLWRTHQHRLASVATITALGLSAISAPGCATEFSEDPPSQAGDTPPPTTTTLPAGDDTNPGTVSPSQDLDPPSATSGPMIIDNDPGVSTPGPTPAGTEPATGTSPATDGPAPTSATDPPVPSDPADDEPAGETVFFDDFEAGVGAWIATTTDWLVVETAEGMLYQQPAVSNELRVAVAGDLAWTDRAVEARVRVLSFGGSSTSYLAGVFARFRDGDNHYYAGVRSDGRVAIRGRIGGSQTTLGTADSSVVTSTGVWYTLRLEAEGSTLRAFLDGVEVISATDSSLPNGGIGVGTVNAAAEFDDVTVTSL